MGMMMVFLLLPGVPVAAGRLPVQGATLIVNTSADEVDTNGRCSLREAITNANNDDQSGSTDCPAGSGADTIVLSVLIYTLSLDASGGHQADPGVHAVSIVSRQ